MEQRGTSSTVTVRSVGLRYGLIIGLVFVAYFAILSALDIQATNGFGLWFKYVFVIALIFFAHRYFKFKKGGEMEFGQGVSIAAWSGLVSGLMDSCFRYVYLKFIDPSFIQKMKEIQMAELSRKGLSEPEIKQAVSLTSFFMNPEFISFIVFLSAFVGAVVVGLVVSIFTKNVFTRNS